VIAASRFDGGPLVQLGFGLCFVSFGGAIAVLLLMFQLDRAPRGPARIAVCALTIGAVGALWLPAYEGVSRDTGTLVVESGWSGLDPVSVVAVVAMAAVMAAVTLVPRVSSKVVAGAAASQAGLLVGNLLIQAFTERPTSVRFGLPVASGLSVAAVLASLVGVRERHR
jgi:hypothetical protein